MSILTLNFYLYRWPSRSRPTDNHETSLLECLWVEESTGCLQNLTYIEITQSPYYLFYGDKVRYESYDAGKALMWFF